MTTSTIGRLSKTVETTTVSTGTLATMTATTRRHENRLATHPRGLTDANLNVNMLIDNRSADTLIVVRQIADILTVVPPTINTLKVDLPTTTFWSATMSALPQIKFNTSIAVSLATSAKFAPTIGPAMTIALIAAIGHPFRVALIVINTETNLHQRLDAPNVLGLTQRAFQTKSLNTSLTYTSVVPVRGLIDCGSATSSMQSCFYTNNLGTRNQLEHTGEIGIAFNGATSPIWETFNTKAIFGLTRYPISLKVIEGSQNKAILGLDFIDDYVKSIQLRKHRIVFQWRNN